MGWQTGDPREELQFKSKGNLLAEFFLFKVNLCSMKAFNLLNEAYRIMEGNLLSSKSAHLNVNLFQKYTHRNIQNV